MKKIIPLLLCILLLCSCSNTVTEITAGSPEQLPAAPVSTPEYTSRFASETRIFLSDAGITVNGGDETNTVYTSRDIIYYEDRDTYNSGNPYGEGSDADKHTADEAAAHTVVNITAPGAYRISGKLSAGQIRVDLGKNACKNADAVAELILDNADITCTVAPAILFLNTYECDGNRSEDTAQPTVDTTSAGASLILEGENSISGSYVARIYKDKAGEKKLWKQDGAIYSYMSMNVFGPGALDLNAANEGINTELHLTINGGNITILSGNDGINTNEDGVSVTTINGGNVTILAGLGAEGDGIDSNGYLVINGGHVISSANPASDAGLDSDLGTFIHGGTVISMGADRNWAESGSRQVAMNLQFAQPQTADSEIRITTTDGTDVFSFTPQWESARDFRGLIFSSSTLTQGQTYHVCIGDTQMSFTGTDMHGETGGQPGKARTDFCMNAAVNSFSGVAAIQ